jgi:hypothetical protein
MVSLLIDYEKIIKPNNLSNLHEKIKPIPHSKYNIGVVLVVQESQLQILKKIPRGKLRVMYINRKEFVDTIEGYAYLIYDKKRKICEIMGIQGFVLENVLESVISSIPNNVTLCVGISMKNKDIELITDDYLKSGFNNPYICKQSPLGYNYPYYGLCMSKQNDIIHDNSAVNEVKYVLKQFKDDLQCCTITSKFSPKTIKYLRKFYNRGSTINSDGSISQKEIAGRFITGYMDENQVFELKLDKQSLIFGLEEGVDIVKGLYNFHTHPQEAYNRHRIKLGWPSAQDYIGFLLSSITHSTILHAVISVEGVYIISIQEYWVNKKQDMGKDIVDFINKKYNKRRRPDRTIPWYLNSINSESYKGFPIFKVQYIEWGNIKDTFSVSFTKKGTNCFVKDKTFSNYNNFY